jgi:hypothetical protein
MSLDQDEEETASGWWWDNLAADAGPMEVWKRLVPAVAAVGTILLLPKSLIFVAAAAMAFDAPGSQNYVWPYLAALWAISFPFVLIASATFGLLAFFRFTRRRLVLAFAIPLLWWMSVKVLVFAAKLLANA